MPTFAASVATYVVLLMLVAAGVTRARRPDELPAALRAHGVLPGAAVPAAATGVAVTEVTLAVMASAGLAGVPGLLEAGLTGTAALFAGIGGYGWHVVASGRSGPCGCGGVAAPMSGWVAGRAAVLAALALLALGVVTARGSDVVVRPAEFGAELAIVALAAGTFAALLWSLPAAMVDREAAVR